VGNECLEKRHAHRQIAFNRLYY